MIKAKKFNDFSFEQTPDKVFKFRILAASLNINFNQHVNH